MGRARARNFANFINDKVKENGAAHIVVMKGDLSKLLNSSQGAKNAMNIMMHLSDVGLISLRDLRSALC